MEIVSLLSFLLDLHHTETPPHIPLLAWGGRALARGRILPGPGRATCQVERQTFLGAVIEKPFA